MQKIIAGLLVCGSLCVITSVVAAQDVDTSSDSATTNPLSPENMPYLDITERKLRVLSEGVENIQRMRTTLEQLGDPTKQETGESDVEYLKRVRRIFKGRALQLHLLDQEYERVLKAMYYVEQDLEKYHQWAEALAERFDTRLSEHAAEVDRLELESSDLEQELRVMASTLHSRLQDSELPADKDFAVELEDYFDEKILANVDDRSEREAKLKDLSTEEIRTLWTKQTNQLVDNENEIRLLRAQVIPETSALAQSLPETHRRVIAMARRTLEDNASELKRVQDQAAFISILSRYARQNLELLPPQDASLLEQRLALIKTFAAEPEIKGAMKDLSGGTVDLDQPRDVRKLLSRVRERAASRESETPPGSP